MEAGAPSERRAEDGCRSQQKHAQGLSHISHLNDLSTITIHLLACHFFSAVWKLFDAYFYTSYQLNTGKKMGLSALDMLEQDWCLLNNNSTSVGFSWLHNLWMTWWVTTWLQHHWKSEFLGPDWRKWEIFGSRQCDKLGRICTYFWLRYILIFLFIMNIYCRVSLRRTVQEGTENKGKSLFFLEFSFWLFLHFINCVRIQK